jgi:hypothetical protein
MSIFHSYMKVIEIGFGLNLVLKHCSKVPKLVKTYIFLEVMSCSFLRDSLHPRYMDVRGPFLKFVDSRQCAAVMQWEAVTDAKL